MKKYFLFFLVLCLLTLSACGIKAPAVTPTEPTTEATTEATVPETTEAITPAPTETTAATEPEKAKVPYLVKIGRADFPIYKGDGYETGLAGYVSTPGTFTVVEESQDCGGNRWGKLKSGAGWVDVTQAEKEAARGPVIEIIPVTDEIINKGGYLQYAFTTDPYTQRILLKANVDLTKVELLTFELTDRLMEQTPSHTIDIWKGGEMLLIEASFPGDMSTYGVRVTDGDGVVYRFHIWENLSGEGDTFGLSTYAP